MIADLAIGSRATHAWPVDEIPSLTVASVDALRKVRRSGPAEESFSVAVDDQVESNDQSNRMKRLVIWSGHGRIESIDVSIRLSLGHAGESPRGPEHRPCPLLWYPRAE